MTPARRIDAHLHVWDLAVSEYAWLGPQFGVLHASWSPGQAARELQRAGMSGAILVQAEDSRVDTRFLLDVAAEHPWVLGVVGWVQLDDPDATARDLDQWQHHPAFCGVRHLINDDPRPDFLDRPAVRESLAELARRRLPFDLHDAWPRHLDQAARLAAELPQLTLVLDHLGKPPARRENLAAWRDSVTRFAAHPNTVAKVSGLSGLPHNVLQEVWDAALELFTPERLMYGGDWPMTVSHGGYLPNWQTLSGLIAGLTPTQQGSILEGTARRTYAIAP